MLEPKDGPQVFDAHGRHAQAVRFTPDGRHLLSAGQDAALRVWRAPRFDPAGAFLGHKNCVNTISMDRDATRVATSSTDKTARIWSFPDGRELHVFKDQAHARFSPDGRHLLTLSTKGRLVLWKDGAEVATLKKLQDRTIAFAFLPGGDTALVGGTGPILRVALPSGEVLDRIEGHGGFTFALTLAPDGNRVYSTGVDATLRAWSVADGSAQAEYPLKSSGVLQIALRADGRRAAVTVEHEIRQFDLVLGKALDPIRIAPKGVYGVAYSPDGRHLACAAADGKIRIWRN